MDGPWKMFIQLILLIMTANSYSLEKREIIHEQSTLMEVSTAQSVAVSLIRRSATQSPSQYKEEEKAGKAEDEEGKEVEEEDEKEEERVDADALKKKLQQIKDNENIVIPDLKDNIQVGDQIFEPDTYAFMIHGIYPRKGVRDERLKWPKEGKFPTVPFNLTIRGDRVLKVIFEAMKDWEFHTCIIFRPKTKYDTSFINFIYDDGCWSTIGRTSWTYQNISLGSGCQHKNTALHEIGHAIGLAHEQMRPDRDASITVKLENVIDEKKDNFIKLSNDSFSNYSIEYDFHSIMQYGSFSFSKNDRITLKTKDPMYQGLLGKRIGLTHRDKLVVNRMYGCLDYWLQDCGFDEDLCENDGYVGKSCDCICPTGTAGSHCENVTGGYYGTEMSDCNMRIRDNDTVVMTQFYPGLLFADTWCMYEIVAPEDYWIEIVFEDFYLESYGKDYACLYASLLVMEDKEENSNDTYFCGSDIYPGYVMNTTTNELLLYLQVSKYSHWSRGFYAVVYFRTNITTEPVQTSVAFGLMSSSLLLFGFFFTLAFVI